MISGIILAAGESKRMGRPKQLLPWKETTILRHVVENAAQSRLGKVTVVLGHQADVIAASLEQTTAQIVVNAEFKQGMISSLKCGVKHSPRDSEAFMTILGDQALIGVDIINSLIDQYRRSKHGIVVPVYNGRRGHPVIFDRKYRDELLTVYSEGGAREILRKYSEDILEVAVASENVLTDIDTVQEYQQVWRKNDRQSQG